MAIPNFREVLMELDAEEAEAVSLLAPDPTAFLRYRGVQIPDDFRLSVEERLEEAAKGEEGCLLLPTNLLVEVVYRDMHLQNRDDRVVEKAVSSSSARDVG